MNRWASLCLQSAFIGAFLFNYAFVMDTPTQSLFYALSCFISWAGGEFYGRLQEKSKDTRELIEKLKDGK